MGATHLTRIMANAGAGGTGMMLMEFMAGKDLTSCLQACRADGSRHFGWYSRCAVGSAWVARACALCAHDCLREHWAGEWG